MVRQHVASSVLRAIYGSCYPDIQGVHAFR
jgi:hypothetical protein